MPDLPPGTGLPPTALDILFGYAAETASEAPKLAPKPQPSPGSEPPVLSQPSQPDGPSEPSVLDIFLGPVSVGPPSPRASIPVAEWRQQEPPCLDGIDDIALNFETDGLDWSKGHRPIGVTVGTLDGLMKRFLPFRFAGGNLDEEVVKRWADRELRGKNIVNARTKFEVHMAREWGIDLEERGNTVSDVQLWAALIDDHRKRFNLDLLMEDFCNEKGPPRVDETRMATYHAGSVGLRAEYQVEAIARLRDEMWPMMDDQDLHAVRQLEDDVIYPLCEMEKNGSLIDVEQLHVMSQEFKSIYGRLMIEMSEELGFAFAHTNKGWSKVFDHLHLTPSDSYDEEFLSSVDHPTVRKGYLAAQYASLNSKSFAPYLEQIDSEGILRYDINQLRGEKGGTVSGRFSIGYVQQVPNHDNHHAAFGDQSINPDDCPGICPLFPRRLFRSLTGEYLEADASQIEYRLFAHHANNKEVIDAYAQDPRLSFHKMTWNMMKVYKPDMLYSHQKNFNFAKMYGARSVKLAIMMGFITEAEGAAIRKAKAWKDPRLAQIQQIEAAYKRMMPEADALLDKASHLAMSECDETCLNDDGSIKRHLVAIHKQFPHRGYVKTLLGRRSRFPSNYKTYIGLNRVIQGTAADIMKQKLVELHRARKHTGLLLRLTVHDAVAGDCQMRETKARVQEILNHQSFPELKVPILWGTKTGPNWAECR